MKDKVVKMDQIDFNNPNIRKHYIQMPKTVEAVQLQNDDGTIDVYINEEFKV